MQENYIEKLDKMFPDGYVIIYTCPDSQIRMSLYNPNKLEQIAEYYEMLKELEEEE